MRLAEWISGIPVIYYPFGLQASAVRFKNSLQENAKRHAMTEDIIEAGHNDIVSWEKKDKVQPILLEGADDYIKTKHRWEIIKKYFQINKIDYKEIFTDEASVAEAFGLTVNLIEGEVNNIKITTPADLRLAESLLLE